MYISNWKLSNFSFTPLNVIQAQIENQMTPILEEEFFFFKFVCMCVWERERERERERWWGRSLIYMINIDY